MEIGDEQRGGRTGAGWRWGVRLPPRARRARLNSSSRLAALALAVLVLGPAAVPAAAQTEQWRQSVPEHDGAMMDIDATDNVFAVGDSVVGDRVTTRKYRPNGALLWERPYPTPGERARASWLSVDSAGAVVVSGYLIVGDVNPAGWVVYKYDAAGNLLWKDTISVSFGRTVRVETDAMGNAYVVGRMGRPNAFGSLTIDTVVIKYAPNGTRLWMRTFDGGDASTADEPYSLALSPDGTRVAAVGSSGLRLFAVIYDAQGNELGRNVQPQLGPARDAAFGPQNLLYLATSRWTQQTSDELTVVKLDGIARTVWIRSFPDGTYAYRIAVDSRGDVVVAGVESPPVTWFLDWVTLKLTPDGTQLWSQPYNQHPSTEEYPYFLELDPAGNIYVTGEGGPRDPSSLLGLQLVTVKYTPTGARAWVAVSGNGRGIAVRPGNNGDAVFVQSLYNMLTVRLANAGTPAPPPPAPPPPAPAPLAAPSGLTITGTTRTQVRLRWTNNTANQLGVTIESCRGVGCTGFVQVGRVSGTATSHVDRGRAPNTTYRYRVRAFDATRTSAYSNTVTAATKG
jgi:hypothetical protein